MSRFAWRSRGRRSRGGGSSTLIIILLLCCSVLVVLGIYGAAEVSDSNKTGVETLRELFEGKITLEDVFSNIQKGGVPCQGSWSDWGACTATCGGGTRNRTWTTTAEPLYGGAACPSPLTQEEACNTGACLPEPCEGSWSGWSGCSATCGGGIKTKTWTTTKEPKRGGTACPSPKTETEDCNTQACPIDCVGEWEDIHGFCEDFGSCGTAMEATFYYDIKTSAAHGGAACPHAQDATKTKSCDLPACPTVDTTETINGVKYDVKYYDSADGHSAYMVVFTNDINYPKNTTYWNGQMVAETGSARYGDADDPTRGSDGHGYLRGDKKKGPYNNRTNYVVKRSQEPIKGGTCELNKTTEYEKSLDGRSDYECVGICGGMKSKSACETTSKSCDYIADGASIYSVASRHGVTLAAACKWIPDGETQDFTEPTWETKKSGGIMSFTMKKLSGDVLKTVAGINPFYYVQSNGVPLQRTAEDAISQTEDKCIKECFKDPQCTGVNTNFPVSSEPENSCTLFSGDVRWGNNGNILGSKGFKLTR